MAFQPPNSGQDYLQWSCEALSNSEEGLFNFERQNRKILEQLEEQKKRLRMQNMPASNVPVSGTATGPIPPVPGAPQIPHMAGTPELPPMLIPDTQVMTPAQRTALQHANTSSVGYFITQDSSFGNLILPVLPRFEKVPQ